MGTDDELHDARQHLQTPGIDVEGELARVHRRAQRARTLRFGSLAVAALVVVAVAVTVVVNRSSGDGQVQVLSANIARDRTTPAQSATAATAVNAFALDLFKQASDHESGNLVLSPYSVDEVLSMALAGARGATHDQIAKVLHTGASEADYHQMLNALNRQLATPRKSQVGGSDPDHPGKTLPEVPPVALHVADSVWTQRGFAVEHAFLDRLARSYGAGVHTVDFEKQAEASRTAINAWVSEHTKGRIPHLLAKGVIDNMTRLVLVNAVTFSGRWTTAFEDPTPGTFTTGSGKMVSTPMMDSRSGTIDGASGPGWVSASVPYVGGAHLLVIMPDNLDAYVGSLNPEKFREATAANNERAWESLTMPTFETTSRVELADPLRALGMPDVFSREHADFSGINRRRRLYVSTIIQQAHIKVDQYGTEAEASTAVVFNTVGKAIGPTPLVLDHPFLYAIVDDSSGAILFMGRVDDPTATP